MNKLEQYLREIVASITLDKQREKDLIEDFNLIRQYLLEILKNINPDFKDIILTNPSTTGIKNTIDNYFDVFFVFDLTKYLNIRIGFDKKRPGFLHLEKRANVVGAKKAPQNRSANLFLDTSGFVHRKNVASTVRDYIEYGLNEYGCYIRGHKGEIYVLELNHQTNKDAILLNAFSENEKLSIEFKILICEDKRMRKVQPFPRNKVKNVWFAALDRIKPTRGPDTAWRHRALSISTPLIDFKVAENVYLCMAYRLLRHLLPDTNEILIRSTVFEEILYLQNKNELLLIDALTLVLLRLAHYFRKNHFPFYFNTGINLLENFNKFSAQSIYSNVKSMLEKLESMRNDQNIEFEAVEQFFGVRVDVNLIKIDSFSAFNSF